MTDLVFDRAAGADAHLVFGDLIGAAPGRTASANMLLGGVTVRAVVAPPIKANVSVLLGGVSVISTAFYDNRVTPWKDFRATILHNPALGAEHENSDDWQTSQIKRDGKAMLHGKANQRPMQAQAGFDKAEPKAESRDALWQLAIKKAQASSSGYQKAVFHQDDRSGGWQVGDDRRVDTMGAMQAGIFKVLYKRGVWQTALSTVKQTEHLCGASLWYQGILRVLPWGLAGFPAPGESAIEPPKPPLPPTFWWDADLLFQCPPLSYPALVFGALPCYVDVPGPAGLVVVPVKRVYIVINSASLRRVDGNIQIPLLNLSMGLDVDSWTWSASASLPGRALDAVAPNGNGDPVEVEALINGVAYRFLVETISRDRTFNQSALKIGMRGKTALLDAPYAMTQSFGNTTDRTMAQLAEDVLTVNGVPMGWAVNWTPEAWTVPTGAFSHQGTYISALNALAGASGAYVQPHRTLQELSVLSRYPTAPWDWPGASPDFELPSAVTVQEGIEWVNRPNYNRVFVSGVSQGVLGQVTRLPTAGDIVAPMVTDALITDAVAVRLRGLPVLADTGRIAKVSLKLPVLPATGIIEPGKMVRYVDGAVTRIGICRSVAVSLGANAVDLRQTITVETHE